MFHPGRRLFSKDKNTPTVPGFTFICRENMCGPTRKQHCYRRATLNRKTGTVFLFSLLEVSHFHPEGRLEVGEDSKQHTDLYIHTLKEVHSVDDAQRWKKKNELCREAGKKQEAES